MPEEKKESEEDSTSKEPVTETKEEKSKKEDSQKDVIEEMKAEVSQPITDIPDEDADGKEKIED